MSSVPEVEPRAATGPGRGKIVLGVIGALLTLIGFGLIAGGGTVLWANASERDGGGFFTSSPSLSSTSTSMPYSAAGSSSSSAQPVS